TAEIHVRGNYAYTTTWGFRDAPGNAVKIWDVSGNTPALVDSVIVPGASTLGDLQTSDDGQLLIVATELSPGSIAIYSLANPVKPQLVSRYSTALTDPGALGSVVTAGGKAHNVWWYHEAATGHKRFAFVGEEGPGSIGASSSGDIHVVDVSNLASPREVAFYHLDGAGTHNFSVDET